MGIYLTEAIFQWIRNDGWGLIMRHAGLLLLVLGLSSCKYEVNIVSFEQKGNVVFKFQRKVLGIHRKHEISCLSGLKVERLNDLHVVWRLEREGNFCYRGTQIRYGLGVVGYKNSLEELEYGEEYRVIVYGSGTSGYGRFRLVR